MSDSIEQAAYVLRESSNIVVFTGAGVSAESGIPTFRDDGGFWEEFPPEEFANWAGLVRAAVATPRRFARFLHAVVAPIAEAQPNEAHRALARAESVAKLTIITQNVDGLHQEAGSLAVHEIHGTFFETVSLKGRFRSLVSRRQVQRAARRLERAAAGWFPLARAVWAMRPLLGIGLRGVYRPNLVMFGDALAEPAWSDARQAVEECDCLVQIGTSGLVMPAATLPETASAYGATIIAIDPSPTPADYWLEGAAADVTPRLFEAAFGDGDAHAVVTR